jgi:hypothetical protein
VIVLDAELVRDLASAVSNGGYVYVATPYSKHPEGHRSAWIDACRAAGQLIASGIPALSPIAHSHPVAMKSGIDPTDHELWMKADAPLLWRSACVLVVKMPSWEISRGVAEEVSMANDHDIPVYYAEWV